MFEPYIVFNLGMVILISDTELEKQLSKPTETKAHASGIVSKRMYAILNF